MTITVAFNTRTSRRDYVIPGVRRVDEKNPNFLYIEAKEGSFRIPWSSIAWTRIEHV